jgi:lysylphosphatidylglycerol synthetase-like protein (DUF2156 family)
MAYPAPPRRPIGVAILAILIILAGLALTIIFGLALLAVIATSQPMFVIAIAAILFLLSLILLLAGMGLWRLSPTAWWLAMIVLLLSLVSQAVRIDWRGPLTFSDLLPVLIVGILFAYMFAVRGAFRTASLPPVR